MAWRIADHVLRGEIDNRVKGSITGKLWLAGHPAPVELELRGTPWQDMAGRLLTFRNPDPRPGIGSGFAHLQHGVCGDMTVSKKIRVPEVLGEETVPSTRCDEFGWFNSIYLEWFSAANGRVVIESHRYEVTLSEPAWDWSAEEEQAQKGLQREAWRGFFARMETASECGKEAEAELGDDLEEAAEMAMINRRLRINELKHQVEKLAGGAMTHGGAPGVPLEVEEQFWRNVLEFESAPVMVRRHVLEKDGVTVRPSAEVPDAELREELWLLIYALAHRRTFLGHTDHLSDRELYRLLVEQVLEEATAVLPPRSGWNCHVFLDEYGNHQEEDGRWTFLRFYASDEFRQEWAEDFPEEIMPPRQMPPYDRDSQLPRATGPEEEQWE